MADDDSKPEEDTEDVAGAEAAKKVFRAASELRLESVVRGDEGAA